MNMPDTYRKQRLTPAMSQPVTDMPVMVTVTAVVMASITIITPTWWPISASASGFPWR